MRIEKQFLMDWKKFTESTSYCKFRPPLSIVNTVNFSVKKKQYYFEIYCNMGQKSNTQK